VSGFPSYFVIRLFAHLPQSAWSASAFYCLEDVHIGAPDAIGFAAENA
jgi:hypothetical protein